MLTTLSVACAILLAVVAGLTFLTLSARRSLSHFAAISDVEAYRDECQSQAETAVQQQLAAQAALQQSQATVSELQTTITNYRQAVGDFKSVHELRSQLKTLRAFYEGCKTLQELTAKIEYHKNLGDQYVQDITSLGFVADQARKAGNLSEQVKSLKETIARLRQEVEVVEEQKTLQEFGFYRSKYDFENSDRFKQRLDRIRSDQKAMIKAESAASCATEWTVEGSKTKGRKMVKDKIKLLLRAFNGECDAAISKVKYNNATALEKRINTSFVQINKMGEVNQVTLSPEYLNLKLQELFLSHEYREKQEQEKEEQRQIRRQMDEEKKVEAEIDRARKEAERDEATKRTALERARAELFAREGANAAKLEELVAKLESELSEAIDRKAKAIARAQLTRSGHVYVLSNIGSFGENVFKIGMTRRLEPQERVKELGSASVPFMFDVHAMIYSEDAPDLETRLHRRFADRRVNLVNHRKEFFNVTLEEIRVAVAENHGEVTFMLDCDAEEYSKTRSLLAEREYATGSGASLPNTFRPRIASVGV
ncbi:hypothetical protein Pla175_45310 [Pirellulimonas nuda]|uniref:Bacteriophage T5 Orf172 DNA-binding domain-containing protein n=1 Tax=Pirellulimonas nuda TaxID=2528009 RepID=A0A518DI04_9BACT|nr:DUF4041 domain-containing protein [Pirellulimonas nuda]QDU91113.1 hypothetical protein Pla175_45310 [Pirellulimonas nuda]